METKPTGFIIPREITLTPAMQQYVNTKKQNPDCIILYRMGDFYETFFDDAKTISRALEITLTSRGKDKIPLAGIPHHAIEPYIARLIKQGYKVAIVEQVEDPKFAKGLVKRELVRIITPGTLIDSTMLESSFNNYIMSINKEEDIHSIAFCDISTGEFQTTTLSLNQLLNEIKKIDPKEIIYPTTIDKEILETLKQENFHLTPHEYRSFWIDQATSTLKEQFNVLNLEGFGITSKLEISCAGAIIDYLKQTQKKSLQHIHKIQEYNTKEIMHLDSSTIRNLELLKNVIDQENATLLNTLDQTKTPMGKRLIRKWIISPLTNQQKIQERLDATTELKEDVFLRQNINHSLKQVYDIERLIGKISYGNANPKDLIALKNSLEKLPQISTLLENAKSNLLKQIANLPDLNEPKNLISQTIKEDPSTLLREGNIIKQGYNQELDDLRKIAKDTKTFLAELEEKEKEKTGIRTLKIKYNKIIGYYIDVTKPNLHLVPEYYIRKQTQVSSERFITEELKEKENQILGAQERIFELELEIFTKVLNDLRQYIHAIQTASIKIAKLDVINSFAEVSANNNYTKPIFDEAIFEIIEGRHAVIEEISNNPFIPNNCNLDNKTTMLITGPNMAGKSTYLRQNALIILLAQIGCLVPATKATLPIFDRIFSRIGAYDNLAKEQSTFMVEMNESANILNNATKNSFVILDEIGRGTSTYDGVSLAWAITEYLNNKIKCKTLFATHYHQLNEMQNIHDGIENYHILIKEENDEILFLRKIVKGGTDKSYGIQVAKLAGIPDEVIRTAKNIQNNLEEESKSPLENKEKKEQEPQQSNNQQTTLEKVSTPTESNELQESSRLDRLENEIQQLKNLLTKNGN